MRTPWVPYQRGYLHMFLAGGLVLALAVVVHGKPEGIRAGTRSIETILCALERVRR